MSKTKGGLLAWSVLLLAGSGCGTEGNPGGTGGGAATDSAGVVLVESNRAAWDADDGWSVDPEPVLAVGEGDVDFVYIADLDVLADGRLVVLDAGTGRVRWIDADGAVTAEAGGIGDGPDEFRGPVGLVTLPGDTVLIWDASARALVAYRDGTRLGRTELPPFAGGSLRTPMALADGSLVVPARTAIGDRPLDSDGRTRFDAPVLLWDRTAEAFDTLTVAPTDEIMTLRIGGRSALGAPPYAKLTSFDVSGDRVYVGDGEAVVDDRGRGWMQVDVLDRSGTLRARYRAPAERGAVEAADRESYIRILEGMARTTQDVQMLPVLRASLVFPDRHPAYGELRVDDGGRVWLRTGPVTPPAPPAGPWTVLSAEGELLGTVEVPDGFELRRIAGDALIGVWRDGFDVQQVRVYRLVR